VRALREGRPPCVRLPGRSVLVLLLLGSEGVIAGLCEARVRFSATFYPLANRYCYSLVVQEGGGDGKWKRR
jgi:hypothetical protein